LKTKQRKNISSQQHGRPKNFKAREKTKGHKLKDGGGEEKREMFLSAVSSTPTCPFAFHQKYLFLQASLTNTRFRPQGSYFLALPTSANIFRTCNSDKNIAALRAGTARIYGKYSVGSAMRARQRLLSFPIFSTSVTTPIIKSLVAIFTPVGVMIIIWRPFIAFTDIEV